MTHSQRFSGSALQALRKARILGIRSGAEHRYTGVWVVVVEERVFVRSWNDKTTGWYRAFRADTSGSIQLDGHDMKIRAVLTRSQRLRDAVTQAYAEKYDTRASQKWVTGFAEEQRVRATLELVPA
jgi:hypothetical protein